MINMTKRNLNKVVLVGRSPELQLAFNAIGAQGYNFGIYGLNWQAIEIYNGQYFNILYFNRNLPKGALNIDRLLKYELKNYVDSLKTSNHDEAKEIAILIFKLCYEILERDGMLK